MRRLLLPCLALAAGIFPARAIDVSPSKDTIPRGSFDTGGNRFSIFNGDPKRIQRANAVDPKAFDASVEASPSPFSLAQARSVGPNPSIKVTFHVHNPAGNVIYTYTDDHDFVQVVGTSMVNFDDKLTYSESVDFESMSTPLAPGTYTIQAVLANYPEIHAQSQFVVTN
jgi:hypothetical protein